MRGSVRRRSRGYLVCSAWRRLRGERPCSLKLPREGQLRSLLSGSSDRTRGNSWNCVRRGLGCLSGRFLPPGVLGQCPGSPGNAPSPEAARAPGVFGQRSQGQGGLLKSSVQGQELDSMILVSPFQFQIFCDFLPGTYARFMCT